MEVGGISLAATARGIGAYAPLAARTTENPAQSAVGLGGASGRIVTDIVDLSPMGLFKSLFGDDLVLNSDGGVNFTKSFEAASATFSERLGNLFRATGIDIAQPIDLRLDSQGHIRVTNDHPDKEKIEALFADNPDLANQFRGLSAVAALLKAAEEHAAFVRAYEADPEAVLRRNEHLFANDRDEVRFRFSAKSLEVLIDSPAGTREVWWITKAPGRV